MIKRTARPIRFRRRGRQEDVFKTKCINSWIEREGHINKGHIESQAYWRIQKELGLKEKYYAKVYFIHSDFGSVCYYRLKPQG